MKNYQAAIAHCTDTRTGESRAAAFAISSLFLHTTKSNRISTTATIKVATSQNQTARYSSSGSQTQRITYIRMYSTESHTQQHHKQYNSSEFGGSSNNNNASMRATPIEDVRTPRPGSVSAAEPTYRTSHVTWPQQQQLLHAGQWLHCTHCINA